MKRLMAVMAAVVVLMGCGGQEDDDLQLPTAPPPPASMMYPSGYQISECEVSTSNPLLQHPTDLNNVPYWNCASGVAKASICYFCSNPYGCERYPIYGSGLFFVCK